MSLSWEEVKALRLVRPLRERLEALQNQPAHLRSPEVAAMLDELAIDVDLPEIFGPTRPLDRGETLVMATRPKTAALVFDRVWGGEPPDEVRYLSGSNYEKDIGRFALISGLSQYRELISQLTWERNFPAYITEQRFERRRNIIAAEVQKEAGVQVSVAFDTETSALADYGPGRTDVVVAALSGMDVVNEEVTEWEQVLEFRKDKESVRKYRRFAHWLDKEMVGQSATFIEREIAQRLEDYKRVIRKHGLKIVKGCLSSIVHKESLIRGAIASGSTMVAAGEFLAMLAGLGVVAGSAALHTAEQLIDYKDLKLTTNPEIAYVHDAKEKLGPKND